MKVLEYKDMDLVYVGKCSVSVRVWLGVNLSVGMRVFTCLMVGFFACLKLYL
jgi:hypothetical protein